MDLLSNYKGKVSGLNDDVEALVCLDIYSQWIQVFPLKSKSFMEIALCLHKFIGKRKYFKHMEIEHRNL